MKILIFSLTYFPFVGGAEVAVKEITNRIDNAEFDLICARLDKKLSKQEKIGNVNVYRVGWGCKLDKYLYPILANLQARKLHKKQHYQIVQAIMAMWGGIAALIFKWLNPNVKYLLTMQSGDTDEFIRRRTWFWAPIYAQVYREADYVQAISQYLARRARRFGYRGEIVVIPNGVDIEHFSQQYSGAELLKLRESLGIKKDEKVVITVSRLVEKNGVEDLVKAFSLLCHPEQYLCHPELDSGSRDCRVGSSLLAMTMQHEMLKRVQHDNLRLLIIGSGKDEKKLKKLAADNIIFLGSINHENLPKYLQISDIFVRPSLSEGLGNAFLEAMLCGLPIIGTPVGGIVDFLKDGETGLFCQPKNPQSIADKISLLLQNSQLYEKLSKNGKKVVLEKYDWNLLSKDMLEVYLELIPLK